jgi:hypothetical protein
MNRLESLTIESDSLVIENWNNQNWIPSSMEHVKFRVNLRGPPRKAKYSWMTDSEIVPW